MMPPKITPERRHGATPSHDPGRGGAGTGGLRAVPAQMRPPAKVPCAECPARRDSHKGHLGGYTPEMYLSVLHGPASIACHCSAGFDSGDISKQRHCTGVAAYRANTGQAAATEGVRAAVQAVVEEHGTDELRRVFFASPSEFLMHHREGQD